LTGRQPPSADDAEARRLAELERQQLAEEEKKKWERLRAPQVVADNANAAALDPAKAGEKGASGTAAEDDPNRRFLASAGSAGVDVSTVNKLDRPDALVTAGTMINAVLITARPPNRRPVRRRRQPIRSPARRRQPPLSRRRRQTRPGRSARNRPRRR